MSASENSNRSHPGVPKCAGCLMYVPAGSAQGECHESPPDGPGRGGATDPRRPRYVNADDWCARHPEFKAWAEGRTLLPVLDDHDPAARRSAWQAVEAEKPPAPRPTTGQPRIALLADTTAPEKPVAPPPPTAAHPTAPKGHRPAP